MESGDIGNTVQIVRRSWKMDFIIMMNLNYTNFFLEMKALLSGGYKFIDM
jgi:hypothetical protein